ncbi:MAG: glycosyltransferase family 39 protein [Bacteroidetes bacterium]|nr:glycosyltransferase family 39 protein [Bacteroidota bacterium]
MSAAKILNRPHRLAVLLLLLLILIGCYRYDRIWQLPPGAIHNWRQVDALSMTDYYYYEHTPLLSPRTYNLFDGDPQVMGEFPGLYWVTARLYDLLGPQEAILRILVSLHFLSLLMAVYMCGWALFRHPAWALVPALFLVSMPVLVYYGNNYLPDVPALSWAAWGVYGFIRYRQGRSRAWVWVVAGFSLGALLKITALLPLAGLVLAEGIRHFRQKIWPRPGWALALLSPWLVGVLWYSYSRAYQAAHTPYFLTKALPVWTYSLAEIRQYLGEMYINWGSFYMSKWLLAFLVLGGGYLLVRWQKGWFWQITGTMAAGLLLFAVMFRGFAPHDYFVIPYYMIGVMLLWQAGLWARSQLNFKQYHLVSALLVVVMGLHLLHTRSQLWGGYYHNGSEFAHPAYREAGFHTFLSQHGVNHHTPVISLPDDTPNLTLYLLKAPGWTQFNLPLDSVPSPALQQKLATQGARFVVLHEPKWKHHPGVRPLLGDSLGTYGPVTLYRFLKQGV